MSTNSNASNHVPVYEDKKMVKFTLKPGPGHKSRHNYDKLKLDRKRNMYYFGTDPKDNDIYYDPTVHPF